MKARPRILGLLLLAAVVVGTAGCQLYFDRFGGGPPPPDRSHEAYYGTGVVTKLEWQQFESLEAILDFTPCSAALYNMCFAAIRDSVPVAKLRVSTQIGALNSRAWIIEGKPLVGDTIVPIQVDSIYGCRPYEYGCTGVVTEVINHPVKWNRAEVSFSPYNPPREYVHLLLVRTNSVVGKVKVEYGQRTVWVLEGMPKVGDLLIGIQQEP
jgi:hypothetical protein